MKKVFLLATLLGIAQGLFAQDNEDTSFFLDHSGKLLTGLNFNYFRLTNETTASQWGTQTNQENETFVFNPYCGVFIHPKYMIGVGYKYERQNGILTNKPLGYNNYLITLNHIGLFGRRYFFPTDRLSFFAQAQLNFGTGKLQVEDNGYQQFANLLSLQSGFSLGMDYLLEKHIGIEVNYGHIGFASFAQYFTNSILESKDITTETGLDFRASTFFIGVNFMF